eukprot:scaffold235548_cov27-Tisochrysis_lutea.AAC.6
MSSRWWAARTAASQSCGGRLPITSTAGSRPWQPAGHAAASGGTAQLSGLGDMSEPSISLKSCSCGLQPALPAAERSWSETLASAAAAALMLPIATVSTASATESTVVPPSWWAASPSMGVITSSSPSSTMPFPSTPPSATPSIAPP